MPRRPVPEFYYVKPRPARSARRAPAAGAGAPDAHRLTTCSYGNGEPSAVPAAEDGRALDQDTFVGNTLGDGYGRAAVKRDRDSHAGAQRSRLLHVRKATRQGENRHGRQGRDERRSTPEHGDSEQSIGLPRTAERRTAGVPFGGPRLRPGDECSVSDWRAE